MHTFTIHQTGQTFSFPSNQEELTAKQRIAFIRLILMYNAGIINMQALKHLLLKDLLNVKSSLTFKYFTPKNNQLAAGTNFFRLTELLDSFFIKENEKYSINLEIPKQFIPHLKHKGKKFFGPDSGFADLTFFEFRTASYYFTQYVEKNSEPDLDRLIALLYRPGKSFWFFRKRMRKCNAIRRISVNADSNPFTLEKRAKFLSSLPFQIKYTILMYCAGSFAYMRNGCPEIDGKEINLERLYKNEPDSESIGMSGLLFSMAESGIFGNIAETDKQNIYTILARMYQLMLQDEEMKRKLKSNAQN
jgi:hypothetical protein